MATEKQIAANRRNALKSRGPVTDEGKARSRRNALTHGLAGEGQVVAEALAKEFDDRRARWAREIRPGTEEARWALDRGVAASIQIEQCEAAYDGLIVEQTARARLGWDGDRRVAAAALMARLAKSPMLVACQLEATRQGAEAMIAVWSRLGEALTANGVWSDDEASVALDLLGVPANLRAGRTRLDAPSGVEPAVHRRGLVIDECRRLSGRIAGGLGELDRVERGTAEASAMVLLSPEAIRLQRYERDAWRRYRESMKAARAGSSGVEAEAEAEVEPEVEPEVAAVSDRSAEIAAYPAILREMQDRLARAKTREEHESLVADIDELIARGERRLGEKSQPTMTAAVASSSPSSPSRPMNRKQRRAMASRARRA